MSNPYHFPLDRLTQVEYRVLTAAEQAARNRQDCARAARRGDEQVAEFERSHALRARAARRERRARKRWQMAVAVLWMPALWAVFTFPVEALLLAVVVAVAGSCGKRGQLTRGGNGLTMVAAA